MDDEDHKEARYPAQQTNGSPDTNNNSNNTDNNINGNENNNNNNDSEPARSNADQQRPIPTTQDVHTREKLFDFIALLQGRRMDDQRASLKP